MNGILVKKGSVWFIKWSDLHSFSYGTHWIYAPLIPTENIDETKFKVGDEVEFDNITNGYSEVNFTPITWAKNVRIKN